jgi:hypothetical protein
MSHIVEFFENRVPDLAGRMFDDILMKSDFWLEASHDWVQWLFPLCEPSNYNPDAPLLTEEDIKFFHSSETALVAANYMAGIKRMFEFLGLSAGKLCVEVTDEDKSKNWNGEFNHNHLRITRMLRSMVLLGFADYATETCNIMITYDIPTSSQYFWIEATKEASLI